MNELYLPIFIVERGELHFFVDYLNSISKIEIDSFIEKIELNKCFSISIKCNDNKMIDYDVIKYFLNGLNHNKIEALFLDFYVPYFYIYQFKDLKRLGFYIGNNEIFILKGFNNLSSLTITNYKDNFKGKMINDTVSFLSFWAKNEKVFDYDLNINNVSTLTFVGYNSVFLDKVTSNCINKLTIYKTKEFIINNNEIINGLKELNIDRSDTKWLTKDNVKRMAHLNKLRLEKCDLSFLTKEIFALFFNLEELIIDDCRNLASVAGINSLIKRVVILNTKINDNDISPLKNLEKVEITRYKDYNTKK